MKVCFKCKVEKPLSDFYKHNMMKDGHLNKCKECSKIDVRENRKKNVGYYREYDRARGNRQDKNYHDERKLKYPKKVKANNMVSNYIRDGKLFREPCGICGEKRSHAHHDDYDKPLNVRWLCAAHHKQWHMENGEGLNA